MAKDKAPQVDLDGDEKLRDYGDQTSFFPFGESEVDGDLVFFGFHDGYKGRAYRAKVEITKSDSEHVKVGKTFLLAFKLDGTPDQVRARKKELRQFVAAIMNEDASAEDFKANDAMATLSEASKEGALTGFGLHISSYDRPGVDSKTKQPIIDKDGKQKIFTNRSYKPRE
jgi:hypothetical protein